MNKIKELFGLLSYKLAPIRKKRIVFTSFQGQYNDNPKAVALKFHELHPEYELVWLLKDEKRSDVPSFFKKVKINTLKAYRYLGSAKIQIDNVYGFRSTFLMDDTRSSKFKAQLHSFLTYKRKQSVFSNFHGVPLKKIGRDQIGNDVKDMVCKGTTLLLGDKFSEETFKRLTFNKLPIKLLGYPRDDVMFENGKVRKEDLHLPDDKKIAIFAPTFRNDGKDVEGKNVRRSGLDQIDMFNFDKLFKTLQDKFDGDWALVFRFHYHVESMVDWKSFKDKYGDRIINGNEFPDMADYLSVSDCLITDCSSSMIDYSFSNKPCFLFFPDFDNYKNKERGFYFDMEKLPFPLTTSFDDFIDSINKFDEKKYIDEVKKFHQSIGSVSDKDSSKRIVEFIYDNYLK